MINTKKIRIPGFTQWLPLLLSLITACTYDFDLGEIKAEEKLVLFSFPGTADTTFIELSRSLPIHTKAASIDHNSATVRLRVNGAEIPLFTATSVTSISRFYALNKWNSGDLIEVDATHKGVPDVHASTFIPVDFPLERLTLVRKPGERGTLQFQINITDDANQHNYYGFRIERKEIYCVSGEYSERTYGLELNLDDEPMLNEVSGLDEVFMVSDRKQWNLYYCNDEKIQGKSYTFRLNTNYVEEFDEDSDELEPTSMRVKYRVSLYSFSEAFYRYLKNRNEIENNHLGNAGLLPIRPSYSNVINGIGVMGGGRLLQTEWIETIK